MDPSQIKTLTPLLEACTKQITQIKKMTNQKLAVPKRFAGTYFSKKMHSLKTERCLK